MDLLLLFVRHHVISSYKSYRADHVLPCFHPSSRDHLSQRFLSFRSLSSSTKPLLFSLSLSSSRTFFVRQFPAGCVDHGASLPTGRIWQQSDASSDLTEIFSDNGSDNDLTSDPELDGEDSDDEDELGDGISDDEGQLPPENYLAQAESLNVSQL